MPAVEGGQGEQDEEGGHAGRQERNIEFGHTIRRSAHHGERFAIQGLVGERGGGARRILGAVTEPHAVRRVLTALGLAAEPPPGGAVPAA